MNADDYLKLADAAGESGGQLNTYADKQELHDFANAAVMESPAIIRSLQAELAALKAAQSQDGGKVGKRYAILRDSLNHPKLDLFVSSKSACEEAGVECFVKIAMDVDAILDEYINMPEPP